MSWLSCERVTWLNFIFSEQDLKESQRMHTPQPALSAESHLPLLGLVSFLADSSRKGQTPASQPTLVPGPGFMASSWLTGSDGKSWEGFSF